MTDTRFTLPDSPELLARAEAVARQRYDDWASMEADPQRWADLWITEREQYIGAALLELRDLTRPASYDAAVRWLAELLAQGEPTDGWVLHLWCGAWMLVRRARGMDASRMVEALAAPDIITDPREALVLALTAALEARR